jgi:hypothetical protein
MDYFAQLFQSLGLLREFEAILKEWFVLFSLPTLCVYSTSTK